VVSFSYETTTPSLCAIVYVAVFNNPWYVEELRHLEEEFAAWIPPQRMFTIEQKDSHEGTVTIASQTGRQILAVGSA
jgi:hypothetical protein